MTSVEMGALTHCCGALSNLIVRLHRGDDEDDTLESTVWLLRSAGRSALAIEVIVLCVQRGIGISTEGR
jgi:hypothetical protein